MALEYAEALARAAGMRAAAPEPEGIVQRIFGGVLQSEVICAACCHISTAYDPFLDISLDIGAPPLPPPPMLKPPAHGTHRCRPPLHASSLCCCMSSSMLKELCCSSL